MGWLFGKKTPSVFVSGETITRTNHDLLVISKYFPLGKERCGTRIPSGEYFSYDNRVNPSDILILIERLALETDFQFAIDVQLFDQEKAAYRGFVCNEQFEKEGTHPIFLPDLLANHPIHLTASIVQQLCEIKLATIFTDKNIIQDAGSVLSFCYGFGIFHILSLNNRESLRHFHLSFLNLETMLYCVASAQDIELNSFEKYQFYISSDNWIRLSELAKAIPDLPGRSKFREEWHQNNSLSWDYQTIARCKVYEQETIDALERLQKVKPDDLMIRHNIAYAHLLHGRLQEAIKGFTYCISSHPYFAYAFNNRGLAYLLTGEFGLGLQDLKTSERLDPENSFNRRNFGIYWLLRDKPELALDELNKTQRMDYATEHIHYWIGRAYYASGNFTEAQKQFEISRAVPEMPFPVYPL